MAPIYNFDDEQKYSSLDQASDFRSLEEQTNGLSAIYDHDNPDIANQEREIVSLVNDSGAWLKLFHRTSDLGQVDDVWEEDANPLYLPPVPVKGMFTPDSVATALTKYGIETKVGFEIHFSRANLLFLFGQRLIRKGDVIQVPHNTLIQTQSTEFLSGPQNQIDKFLVTEAKDTGNFNYRWMYWTCTVQNVAGDITVRPKT